VDHGTSATPCSLFVSQAALAQTGALVLAALTDQPVAAVPDQQRNGRPASTGRPPSHALTRSRQSFCVGADLKEATCLFRPRGCCPRSPMTVARSSTPGCRALTAALVEDLSLIGGARIIECELSTLERRRRRDRARRAAYEAVPEWFSVDDLVPTAFERARRLL
jgi:hypothetical protein